MEINFPCRLTVYFNPGSWESTTIDSQEQLDKWTGALRKYKHQYAISSTSADLTYNKTDIKLLTDGKPKKFRERYVGWLHYLSKYVWPIEQKTMGYRKKMVKTTEDNNE